MNPFYSCVLVFLVFSNCNRSDNHPPKTNPTIPKPVIHATNKQVKPLIKDPCLHVYLPKLNFADAGNYYNEIEKTKKLCRTRHGSCCYALAEFAYYNTKLENEYNWAIENSSKGDILEHYMCDIRRSNYFRRALAFDNPVAKYIEGRCTNTSIQDDLAESLETNCNNGYLYACLFFTHMTLEKQAEDLDNIEKLCMKLGTPICTLFQDTIEENVENQKFSRKDVQLFNIKMLFMGIPILTKTYFEDFADQSVENQFREYAEDQLGIVIKQGESKKIKYLKIIIADSVNGQTVPGRYLMREKIWTPEERQILQNYSDNLRRTNFRDIFKAAGRLEEIKRN